MSTQSLPLNTYPDRHHPCFFLEDSLKALGAEAEVVRDVRTLGCWGLIVNGKPMVWLIDNRHAHEAAHEDPAAKELLARGVLVCHAQKEDQQRVGGKWLPLACTPEYLNPSIQKKTHDAAFVGYVRDMGRSTLLAHLGAFCSLNLASGVFGKHAVETYTAAICGINIPTRYGQPECYDINMRVFEIAGCGALLVTNRLSALAELGFVHGRNALLFDSPDHLAWLVQKAIAHSEKAMETAEAGRKLIKERHLYTHRAKQVLEWLN